VLKYGAGSGGAVATRDLAAAISYVFRHAKALGVGTQGFSLWGSSAGARMAAAIGSHGVESFGGDNLPKPSAVVMAYTGHSDYSDNEPPTFGVIGERDAIAAPSVMERRVAALRKTRYAFRERDNGGDIAHVVGKLLYGRSVHRRSGRVRAGPGRTRSG
jgi:acetyl esterase/lipase